MDFSIFALLCISATPAAFCAKKGDDRERTTATGILHVLLEPQVLVWERRSLPSGFSLHDTRMWVWGGGVRVGAEGWERMRKDKRNTSENRQAGLLAHWVPPSFCLHLMPIQASGSFWVQAREDLQWKKKLRETHHLFNNTHFMISFSYLLATIYFTESSDSGVIIAINEREGTKCAHSSISRIGTHSLPCECQPLKWEVPVSSLVMEL